MSTRFQFLAIGHWSDTEIEPAMYLSRTLDGARRWVRRRKRNEPCPARFEIIEFRDGLDATHHDIAGEGFKEADDGEHAIPRFDFYDSRKLSKSLEEIIDAGGVVVLTKNPTIEEEGETAYPYAALSYETHEEFIEQPELYTGGHGDNILDCLVRLVDCKGVEPTAWDESCLKVPTTDFRVLEYDAMPPYDDLQEAVRELGGKLADLLSTLIAFIHGATEVDGHTRDRIIVSALAAAHTMEVMRAKFAGEPIE